MELVGKIIYTAAAKEQKDLPATAKVQQQFVHQTHTGQKKRPKCLITVIFDTFGFETLRVTCWAQMT